MAKDQVPSIGITADTNSITITLPDPGDTSIPRIPEKLRDEDIPSFVAEWILESDEIGVLIQELLQAPTKSLCRIYRVPTGGGAQEVGLPEDFGGFRFGAPKVNRPVFQPRLAAAGGGFGDVMGFDADAPTVIDTLPEGVQLPARLAEITDMAARVAAWIEKGQRVRIWAEERGFGDASWLPETS